MPIPPTTLRARGCLSLNGHAYFAIGNTIYDVLPNGSLNAAYGPIDNDNQPVTFAANFFQIGIVSAGKAYYIQDNLLKLVPWLTNHTILNIAFLDQFFLFLAKPITGDNETNGFYFSEPGDITLGNDLNFVSAEANANNFTRIMVQDERIWLFGDAVTQVFVNNSQNDPTNPFVPDFSGVIMQGTAAPYSVVGAFDSTLAWVSRNASGQGVAYRNNGYQPQRISTFAVEEAWRKYGTIADAVAYTFVFKGHTVWRVWFPNANETWQYDASLPPGLGWTKVLYFNPISGQYEADRISCACEVNGVVMGGDRENGKVHEITLDALDDNGDRIRWLRRAPIISNENKFISFPWFELDCQVGVGDGSNGDPTLGPVTPEFDPQVMMRYSNDWGQTWSSEYWRSMGKKGEYRKRVFWSRPGGAARQRVYEVSGTASVPVAINSVYLRNPLSRTT